MIIIKNILVVVFQVLAVALFLPIRLVFNLCVYKPINILLRSYCLINHGDDRSEASGISYAYLECYRCKALAERHKWYDYFVPYSRSEAEGMPYKGLHVRREEDFGVWSYGVWSLD